MDNEEKMRKLESLNNALFERLGINDPSTYTPIHILKASIVTDIANYLQLPKALLGTEVIVEMIRALADSLELAGKIGLDKK